MDDHYTILGISEDATAEEVHAAWRREAFKHHPDKNRDNIEEAHRRMVAINIAYEILNNNRDRSRFDDLVKRTKEKTQKTWNSGQQQAYQEAQRRYQESEAEARERVKKWFYDRPSVRPTKRHRCYRLKGNKTSLDRLIGAISTRLGDKAWEFRVRSTPDLEGRLTYRVRVVCDPAKCAFREHHLDWVQDHHYGLFKPGTKEDAEHNKQLVRSWLGDILDQGTSSYKIFVFFGIHSHPIRMR